MKPVKTETDMFFARLASSIESDERRARAKEAEGIANALAGSTQKERDAAQAKFNADCDALEAALRKAIELRKKSQT